jgi:hypothetical protein
VLKPKGGTETGNASQYLGVSTGDLPKYALTCEFLKPTKASAIGIICDTISLFSESCTITFS